MKDDFSGLPGTVVTLPVLITATIAGSKENAPEPEFRAVRKMIESSGKDMTLGVDVFPDPAESEIEIGQSWVTWADEVLIDYACPMLYTDSLSYFIKYLDRALVTAGNKCSVIPGIGLITSHNKITPDLMVAEINASHSRGAAGVAFFSGYSLSEDLISILTGFH